MKQKLERAKLIRQLVEEAKSLFGGDKRAAAQAMDAEVPGWTVVAVVDPDFEVVDPEVVQASNDDAPEPAERELMEAAGDHGMAPERAEAPDRAERIKRALCALKHAMRS